MIRKYLSMLTFQYERTLIYMLQQTEYDPKKYLKWLHRVKDFRQVEKRGKMVPTLKAHLLFDSLAIIVLIYTGLVLWWSYSLVSLWGAGVALILVLIIPIWAQYVILLPLILGHLLVQKPRSKQILGVAKKKLAEHGGIKIAVVGSYGKTTAKEVLKTVLLGGKKVAATPGNINQPLGFARFINSLDGDEDVLIFEMGEYRLGDLAKMCEFVQPEIGFITGVSEAHLENFGTLSNITKELFTIKEYLDEKLLYLNGDNEILAKKGNATSVLYSENGLDGNPAHEVKISALGTDFKFDKFVVHSKLLGRHNIGIVAAAIDLAKKLGLNDSEIKKGLECVEPFEHRMQPRSINGAFLIDDTYNGNFEGVKAGIRLVAEIPAQRKIYVTPGLVEQGDKTEEIHREIGRLLAGSDFDEIVLMQNSVTDFIKIGLDSAKFSGKLTIIDDPLYFYENLALFVTNGDLVLMQNDWTDNY